MHDERPDVCDCLVVDYHILFPFEKGAEIISQLLEDIKGRTPLVSKFSYYSVFVHIVDVYTLVSLVHY